MQGVGLALARGDWKAFQLSPTGLVEINNNFAQNISTFPLHDYMYIICYMITYNFGKTINCIMWIINRFSTWGLLFHNDCWALIFFPHESFIYLQNHSLVMLRGYHTLFIILLAIMSFTILQIKSFTFLPRRVQNVCSGR